MSRRRRGSLRDRVSHAYFMYGRFCSHHPTMTMLVSIFTLLFLSYPLTRIRLPSSTPIDAVWGDTDVGDQPTWLKRQHSQFTLLQFLVRGRVEPWDSREFQPFQSVRGPLSRAFKLRELLMQFTVQGNNERLFDMCVHVQRPQTEISSILPSHDCLLLSPALLWQNDAQNLLNDADILNTVFSQQCTSLSCPRELLFGVPIKVTGIQPNYQVNQARTIQYVVTLVIDSENFDAKIVDRLKESLSQSSDFTLVNLEKAKLDKNRIVNVFYNLQKTWTELLPLALSYCVLLVYLYYSVSKIEMVKSKWGLAFSCVFTVASSLVMAAGICCQFDMIPTFWGAEIFPYLAMIVGMENTLCITRSVVKIPVEYPVPLRIAHGLSKEGYSITKNFMTELLIVLVGFFTFVPEIQEFCLFGCVGLVVDFYMQLFFYAPCLTFDMLRIGSEDKQQIGLNQLKLGTPSVQLDSYPTVQCPVMKFIPQLRFLYPANYVPNLKAHLQRARSESELNEDAGIHRVDSKKFGHKRAASNTSDIFVNVEPRSVLTMLPPQMPRRLRILYFWARTRFFQRFLMLLTVLWIIWLAFIVHELQLMQQLTTNDKLIENKVDNATGNMNTHEHADNTYEKTSFQKFADDLKSKLRPPNIDLSENWMLWQRKTFRWWPYLLDQYNMTLSGRYITILPLIVLDTIIPPTDPFVHLVPPNPEKPVPETDKAESLASLIPDSVKLRISWLELQMTIVLIMSCSIFFIVAAFLMFLCLAGRGSDKPTSSRGQTHRRIGSRGGTYAPPTLLVGHARDIECVCYTSNSQRLISSCLGNQVIIWDINNAVICRSLPRGHVGRSSSQSLPTTPDPNLRRRNVNGENGSHGNSGVPMLELPTDEKLPVAVWCMTVAKGLLVLGCADGSIELWDCQSGTQLSQFTNTKHGVTQVAISGSRLVMARLNGCVDFVELRLQNDRSSSQQTRSPRLYCSLILSTSAHHRPINCLLVTVINPTLSLAVTCCHDHTCKLFDIRTGRVTQTLYGHTSAVTNAVFDHSNKLLYSSCSSGCICCWSLPDGMLVKRIQDIVQEGSLKLAVSQQYLLAYDNGGVMWLWNKDNLQLITSIRKQTDENCNEMKDNTAFISGTGSPIMVLLDSKIVVTAWGSKLRFWNLDYKVLVREIDLEKENDKNFHISNLLSINQQSVVCTRGNTAYKVNIPEISLN